MDNCSQIGSLEENLKKIIVIPSTVERVIWKKKVCVCVCVRVKGQKNISYENIEMSFLTPDEGLMVNDSPL